LGPGILVVGNVELGHCLRMEQHSPCLSGRLYFRSRRPVAVINSSLCLVRCVMDAKDLVSFLLRLLIHTALSCALLHSVIPVNASLAQMCIQAAETGPIHLSLQPNHTTSVPTITCTQIVIAPAQDPRLGLGLGLGTTSFYLQTSVIYFPRGLLLPVNHSRDSHSRPK